MNATKHITKGTVLIVAFGNEDPWDTAKPAKTGKVFEKQIFPGGAIIGSKDCGWTKEIVGRFFAVDEPSEYLDPKNDPSVGYTAAPDMRVYRWYQIQKFEERPDGTRRIYVERTRWWSRNDVAPNLYDSDNYTWDDHVRPFHYIIAPGAYVSDVSRAWTDSYGSGGRVEANNPRALKLAPTPDIGTRFDFEKGDPIVQAIGQDPWNVTGLRVRHWNYLPSTLPDSSLQAVNQGRVAVDSALGIHGGGGDLKEIEMQKDKRPRFQKGIDITAISGVGIRFGADVKEAAIRFEQPHGRPQPIVWDTSSGNPSSLIVDPKTGDMELKGGATRVSSLVVGPNGGISASATLARNLRGIAVPVKKGATELEIKFVQAEADANYAVHIQPTWLTAIAVTKKTANYFTIRFDQPAPDAATVDWILIR